MIAVLFVVVLVILAHMSGPEPSGRCCKNPAHWTPPGQFEIGYCPTRDR
jgi:hypothetical protein